MNNFLLVLSTLLLSLSCTKSGFENTFSNKKPIRFMAGQADQPWINDLAKQADHKGHTLEFPPGLSIDEKLSLWHLSEGSEIYPTLWLVHLKSQLSKERNTSFLENLDKKFGVIADDYAIDNNYPIPWVGITAAWSSQDLRDAELYLEDGQSLESITKVKHTSGGSPSIAMTGVNCSFCHTGHMKFIDADNNEHTKIIEGAASMADIRGFFKDLMGSTIKTMVEAKLLEEFLLGFDVPDAKNIAKNFSKNFAKELGLGSKTIRSIVSVLEHAPFIGNKVANSKLEKVSRTLFQKQNIIEKYLTELLKITYSLETVPDVLRLRMKYLANLGAPDPDLNEVPSGFARTDAFGRISNAIARIKNPAPLNANVSLPHMFGIKYRAMFHYNGNTNSVISRNIGQSFGLGAILDKPLANDDDKYSSTSNLFNLITLEKLLYKIEVPEFQKIFPSAHIDSQKVVNGCNTYVKKCMGCHQAKDQRAGPSKKLINHKIINAKKVGTDFTYIENQMQKVAGIPFRKAIFDFTDNIKAKFFKTYNVSDETVAQWANSEIRGEEVFRDTYLGYNEFAGNMVMDYTTITKGNGYMAKDLSGIWSTAPYLHNGSVPSIFELLKPSSQRVSKFFVGSHVFNKDEMGYAYDQTSHYKWDSQNPTSSFDSFWKSNCGNNEAECFDTSLSGNSNAGHEPSMYGGELTHIQKYEVIEFLKVLRPDLEYSWPSKPIYKILDDGSCISYEQ